ncbi:MAG: cytochrome c maturation protein CcmE [Deltaproteobacteria bacterium]|nr:cytochrome c maturation protein CcmE [Deltaproteobacteria bacterium]MBI4224373.1 cytochrome c maturation protein CcmE [Deltaproteobacteria bacterium]
MNRIGLIVSIAVVLGALGFLIFGQLEKNLVYFLTPSELLAKGEAAVDQPLRLGGEVKKDSVVWDAGRRAVHFLLTDGQKDVFVSSETTPPQMFQEEMGVVVEGKLLDDGHFEADRLMVKHSNEYHPPKEGEKPSFLYQDLIKKRATD